MLDRDTIHPRRSCADGGVTLGARMTPGIARALLVAVIAIAGLLLPNRSAWGEPAGCQSVDLAGATSNVELVVQPSAGTTSHVRLAGLQTWPTGWPLADRLPVQVAALARSVPICLTADAVDRAPDGVPLRQARFSDGSGWLGVLIAEQGWAQVAPDAERTTPSLAAALRMAEARAREARRGIWEILDNLVPYATPSAGTTRVDARLVAGLDVLAGVDDGRPLVDTLARANVVVFMAPEPSGIWAHYDTGARIIVVDSTLAGADARTLATLISHEATHARGDYDDLVRQEARTIGAANACYADELRASIAELRVWQQLHGPRGKAAPRHAYEHQANRELLSYQRSPDRYAERLVEDYAAQCGR